MSGSGRPVTVAAVRRRTAALVIAGVVGLAGCTDANRSPEAACSALDGLTLRQGALTTGADVAEVAAELARLEDVIPDDYLGDVRALRDGITRVLELASAHPEVEELSGLPPDVREEARDTLTAVTWPARRIEEFRVSACQ